jgi:hypothetical protein
MDIWETEVITKPTTSTLVRNELHWLLVIRKIDYSFAVKVSALSTGYNAAVVTWHEDIEAVTNHFPALQYSVSRPHGQMGGTSSRALFIQGDFVLTEHVWR